MSETKVVLVDRNDNFIGVIDKMEAHEKGLLHRAISVFVCNSKGEWLLQRRALEKYHSAGLWTNTSCSHPFQEETNLEAANRRLREEMGIECELKELFAFIYKEELDNNLIEYEYDHVFLGITDQLPIVDSGEVMDWKYMSYTDMQKDIQINKELYTVWFKKIFEKVNEYCNNMYNFKP